MNTLKISEVRTSAIPIVEPSIISIAIVVLLVIGVCLGIGLSLFLGLGDLDIGS